MRFPNKMPRRNNRQKMAWRTKVIDTEEVIP